MTIDQLLDGIIEREQGFVSHPADRGGPTNWGITKRTYEEWVGRRASTSEIQRMPRNTAREIYRRRYLTNYGIDQIAFEPLRILLADLCVNSGPDDVARCVQQYAGLTEDGVLGPQTRAAMMSADGPLLWRYAFGYRVRLYMRLALQEPATVEFLEDKKNATLQLHNLRGWMNRMVAILPDTRFFKDGDV